MYEKELKLAISAVKKSEPTFRKYFGTRTKVETKGNNPRDLVSYADKKIQQEIKTYLAKKIPEIGFIGEENGETTSNSKTAWVLDPIDGTSNYLQGLSDCAVSLGLVKQGKSIVGVVFAPLLGRLYTAAGGGGARMNGKIIKSGKVKKLKQAVGGMGWGRNVNFAGKFFPKLVSRALKVRVPASASLGICYTAQGSYDFFIDREMKIWDYAAGKIILEEAGGKFLISDKPKIQIAANSTLATALFDFSRNILK